MIIDIIKNKNPSFSFFIPEPVFHQIIYIGLRIIATQDFNLVRYISETLLESGCVTRMDPEDPCCRCLSSNLVRIFDG